MFGLLIVQKKKKKKALGRLWLSFSAVQTKVDWKFNTENLRLHINIQSEAASATFPAWAKVRRWKWVTRKWVDHRAKEEEADNMDNTSRVASRVDWLMRLRGKLHTHLLESRGDDISFQSATEWRLKCGRILCHISIVSKLWLTFSYCLLASIAFFNTRLATASQFHSWKVFPCNWIILLKNKICQKLTSEPSKGCKLTCFCLLFSFSPLLGKSLALLSVAVALATRPAVTE